MRELSVTEVNVVSGGQSCLASVATGAVKGAIRGAKITKNVPGAVVGAVIGGVWSASQNCTEEE